VTESVNPYAALPRSELLALCTERGVPSYGTMAEIAARLAKRDTQAAAAAEAGPDVEELLGVAEFGTVEIVRAEPDEPPAPVAPPPSGPPAVQPEPPQASARPVNDATNPLLFTHEFAVYGPPDDASHHRMLAEVVALARAAGHRTRGGGQRLRTVQGPGGRVEVYGVSIRPAG